MDHLPTTLKEAKALGYDQLDVIIVSADAYVDHPSFAPAIIGRYLQSLGLRVGIIPQPDWSNVDNFKVLGQPRMFFGVTAGNLDSMVNLYTAQRRIRSQDLYSEDGQPGKRPYLPTIIYTNRLKQAFKGVPVVLGGIEASLRRIAHYDFYTDKLRPSILLDAKADLLIYGNGEKPLKEIISLLQKGVPLQDIRDIRGTVVPIKQKEKGSIRLIRPLPSFESVKADKNNFLKMTRIILQNLNPYNAVALYQETGSQGILINPPAIPLPPQELDAVYSLPFTRKPHPRYKKEIPALRTVINSITAHRGCYGGCSFCSIYFHQGKFIQSRSAQSILKEIRHMIAGHKNKSLVLTDIGGPTANMYGTFCRNEKMKKKCQRTSCLYPVICSNLQTSMRSYLSLLHQIKKSHVKHVFINSGIRMDLALKDKSFVEILAREYTQGRLSVAPEHVHNKILQLMNKPNITIFEQFCRFFKQFSKKAGKVQYITPYFIIGFPGTDEQTEQSLIRYLSAHRISAEQVQEFYPLPMTLAAAMYYTGKDIQSGQDIKVEKKLGMKKIWKRSIRSD